MTEGDTLHYIENNLPSFLSNLRFLSKEDQELLLSYYILAKTQTTLTHLHQSTQTICSSRIRMAMKKMGNFILHGAPTKELLRDCFLHHGIEDTLSTPLSELLAMYAESRSFQQVADAFGLHRPDVRRALTQASRTLQEAPDLRHRALGAYVFDLVDKASASGQGFSRRKLAKQGHLYHRDGSILGHYRMNVSDPEFVREVFVSRANR